MRIKITKSGTLEIDGRFQGCPYTEDGTSCGAWCALFREPWVKSSPSNPDTVLGIVVSLCHQDWQCEEEEFTDERKEEEK